jgi:hypothetical protein
MRFGSREHLLPLSEPTSHGHMEGNMSICSRIDFVSMFSNSVLWPTMLGSTTAVQMLGNVLDQCKRLVPSSTNLGPTVNCADEKSQGAVGPVDCSSIGMSRGSNLMRRVVAEEKRDPPLFFLSLPAFPIAILWLPSPRRTAPRRRKPIRHAAPPLKRRPFLRQPPSSSVPSSPPASPPHPPSLLIISCPYCGSRILTKVASTGRRPGFRLSSSHSHRIIPFFRCSSCFNQSSHVAALSASIILSQSRFSCCGSSHKSSRFLSPPVRALHSSIGSSRTPGGSAKTGAK